VKEKVDKFADKVKERVNPDRDSEDETANRS